MTIARPISHIQVLIQPTFIFFFLCFIGYCLILWVFLEERCLCPYTCFLVFFSKYFEAANYFGLITHSKVQIRKTFTLFFDASLDTECSLSDASMETSSPWESVSCIFLFSAWNIAKIFNPRNGMLLLKEITLIQCTVGHWCCCLPAIITLLLMPFSSPSRTPLNSLSY